MSDLARWCEAWQLDCRANNASPEYLDKAAFITAKLLWWLRREKLPECGANEIRRFQIYVQEAHALPEGRWGDPGQTGRPSRCYHPVRTRTVLNYWRLLRTLFAWLVEQGALGITPFKTLRAPEHNADEIQPFTEEQIRALVEATKRSPDPHRNRAILLFLLDTGVRASELCALKWRDVDLSEPGRPCATILGKGRKRRTVYWSPETQRALHGYLQQSGGRGGDDPLFRSDSYQSADGHLGRRALGKLIERLGEAAGVEGVRCSPHTFRNTYAVMFLRAGGPEIALMTNLGHTSLEMSRKYVLFARADRANHARAFSPVANLGKRSR